MRIALTIVIVVAVLGLVGGAGWAMRPHTIRPRALSYPAADGTSARREAEVIAAGLSRHDQRPFNLLLDIDYLCEQAVADVPLTTRQRGEFAAGMRKGVADDSGFGGQYARSLGENCSVRVLRARRVDGQQHVILRLIGSDGGLNYLELSFVKAPDGRTRVLDGRDYMAGVLFSENFRQVAEPIAAKLGANEALSQDVLSVGAGCQRIRALIAQDKGAEALTVYCGLPATFRDSRPGLLLRLQCAQKIEGEYVAVLAEFERRFPDDPTLALMRIDAAVLAKDFAKALACVDVVDRAIGGDPYLDVTRASVELQTGAVAAAQDQMRRLVEACPDLKQAWFAALGVSLTAKAHAETARLLNEAGRRFDITWHVEQSAAYADFVASSEYAAWKAQQGGGQR